MTRRTRFSFSLAAALALGMIHEVRVPKGASKKQILKAERQVAGGGRSGPRPTPKPKTRMKRKHPNPRARAGIRRRRNRLRR